MNVLIVDDINENRLLLQIIFQYSGYNVIEAANGLEALGMLDKNNIDLIISDVLMPTIDGFNFCHEVKEHPKWCNIPFVFYTATYVAKNDLEFGMALGADYYLTKPLESSILLKIANELLQKVANNTYQPKKPAIDSNIEYLKEYNNRLLVKMETKILQLEKSEQLYRALFECASDAIFTCNSNQIITSMNKVAEIIFGCTKEQLIGKDIITIIPESKTDEHTLILRELNNKGTPATFESIRKRVTGEEFFAEISISILNSGNNRLHGYAIAIRDIGQRKKTEQELIQSKSKLKKLILVSANGIIITDENGIIRTWNHSMERIAEKPYEEMLNMPVWQMYNDLISKYPENSTALQTLKTDVQQAVKTGYLKNAGNRIEFMYQAPSGKVKYIEAYLIIIDLNNQYALAAICSEITERKKIEAELKELNEKLEQRISQRTVELEEKTNNLSQSKQALTYLIEDINSSREELQKTNEKLKEANSELESFAYFVSHDLKAPLRAINGFSNILMSGFTHEMPEEMKLHLSRIIANSEKMTQLINDLLEFSKIGRKEMIKTTLDMNVLVTEVFEEVKLAEPNRTIELVLHPLPEISVDARLFKQCLLNIISNAVKYSRNTEHAIIEIGCTPANNRTEFYVKDNGIGFDMKYASKLFNVFQRLHNESEFEGTGIGLALVKRILSRHSGEVWINSEPKKGTTVYFTLAQ